MTYVLEGPKWGSSVRGTSATVTWSFADLDLTSKFDATYKGYPDIDGGISVDYRDLIRNAFGVWASVTGVTFVEMADSTSSNIRLGQADIDGAGSVVGQAAYWYTGSTFLTAAISFDTDAFTSPGIFYSVALHEIGHAIGLGHSTSPDDTMYPYVSAQNVGGLSAEDMAGARALYTTGLMLQGTDISDLLTGGIGDDVIYGNGGNDTIYAREGADTIIAVAGNNIIVGGLDSNDGADLITAGAGNDLIYGNGGDDTISSTGGNDIVVGGFGVDVITLGAGNDIVYGNQDNDTINAGDGNNLVTGGRGDDNIVTGNGSDIIFGNEGNDTMTGGGGADRFIFDIGSGADVITDFQAGQGDHLDLYGQNYTVVGTATGDAMLVLSGGGTIQLNGVTAAGFSGSFIA